MIRRTTMFKPQFLQFPGRKALLMELWKAQISNLPQNGMKICLKMALASKTNPNSLTKIA